MSVTTDQSPLPSRHSVRNTIEGMVGRDVDLSDGVPPAAKSTNVVAVYVTDQLKTSALVVVDLECAARLGGSLGMIPRGAVDDAIKARELPKDLEENCYEVLNVMASIFNLPNHPHVRLYEMYAPNSAIPADIAQLAATVGNRMDVKLKIAGYGEGALAIVIK
ncbi:hypothetical protein KIH74_20790 [Kineosporia sp. J2-2]|uniref:Uncharacterized protein n=1 Tax=Kineosporia corallincola TaxID=2835133 RepID=A0ABS5TJX7_9ACTN|nr:hypothetical protein [Kineosporia corallincola]MBT0771387.1 hypothetical protein [Kineosporia corallincola]